jgi:L-threonylcarbamoyladenylate synthase
VSTFAATIGSGGVVLFPSDTVYGLACDPLDAEAIERLYALKGRAPDKAAAVMFFSLPAALAALPELGSVTRAAMEALLPGGVTLLLPNPERRFPLACRADPTTLGLRVIAVDVLGRPPAPVLQSSANRSGQPEARRLADVDPSISAGVALAIDGGELPGIASTVIDLRSYEQDRDWTIVRQGLVGVTAVAAALDVD